MTRALILAAAAAALLTTGPAAAQLACLSIEAVGAMTARYGEVEAASGISGAGFALTIYANPETGSYTVVLVSPVNPALACIVGTGTDWALVPPAAKPGTPS